MTIPEVTVNRVFSITPVTGTPVSVAGIAALGVVEGLPAGDAIVEAEGEDTNAGSNPVLLGLI